jgi:hypothetical protein
MVAQMSLNCNSKRHGKSTIDCSVSTSTAVPTICNGSSTTLTQTGGSLGTGASWKWYSNAGLLHWN